MNGKRQSEPLFVTPLQALQTSDWKEMKRQEASSFETLNVTKIYKQYVGEGVPCTYTVWANVFSFKKKGSWRSFKVCEVQVITQPMLPEKFYNSP